MIKSHFLLSLVLGIVFTICFGSYTKAYSQKIQNSISDEFIRLHVKANSNTEEDQLLKQQVKDEILTYFKTELETSQDKEQTKQFLQQNLDNIVTVCENKIQQLGYNYSVTAKISNKYFPTKIYGDISLPAGTYEALEVNIGEAYGSNWWCVMFPPLCYVDVTQKEIPKQYKEQLKYILTSDEYELISNDQKKITVEIKFKIVEWWQRQQEKRSKNQVVIK